MLNLLIYKSGMMAQTWWNMPITVQLRRLRQECLMMKNMLRYIKHLIEGNINSNSADLAKLLRELGEAVQLESVQSI